MGKQVLSFTDRSLGGQVQGMLTKYGPILTNTQLTVQTNTHKAGWDKNSSALEKKSTESDLNSCCMARGIAEICQI